MGAYRRGDKRCLGRISEKWEPVLGYKSFQFVSRKGPAMVLLWAFSFHFLPRFEPFQGLATNPPRKKFMGRSSLPRSRLRSSSFLLLGGRVVGRGLGAAARAERRRHRRAGLFR